MADFTGARDCPLAIVLPFPLLAHQPRLPKESVYPLGIPAGLECEKCAECRVCLRRRSVACGIATPQRIELLAVDCPLRPFNECRV